MEIVNYFESEAQPVILNKLDLCPWSAGRYLAELLCSGRFAEQMGEGGSLFLLMDGTDLVSFATLTMRDCIADAELFPWIGFVYTAPERRGNGFAGAVLSHAEAVARQQGYERVYLATDHVGLYERYGYEFLENRMDIWGNEERILYKNLKGAKRA